MLNKIKHSENCTQTIYNPKFDENCPGCMHQDGLLNHLSCYRNENGEIVYSMMKGAEKHTISIEDEKEIINQYLASGHEISGGQLIEIYDANRLETHEPLN